MSIAKECAACGWDGTLRRLPCPGCGEEKWYCSDCNAVGKAFNCSECQAHSGEPACPGFMGDPNNHPCQCGDHAHCAAGPPQMVDRKCFVCQRKMSVPDLYQEETVTMACPRCSVRLDPTAQQEVSVYGVFDKTYVQNLVQFNTRVWSN